MAHGGKRNGAGRPSGARNKATLNHKACLSELAREHSVVAIETLVQISRNGLSENARVSAAIALLDRAFGKPAAQAVTEAAKNDCPTTVRLVAARAI